jgi:hypothetical protein
MSGGRSKLKMLLSPAALLGGQLKGKQTHSLGAGERRKRSYVRKLQGRRQTDRQRWHACEQ